MNRQLDHKILLLTLALSVIGLATGCTIAASPATVSVAPAPTTTVVHHTVAPARVYHNGSWLYYRTDGYYYSSGSRWVAARSVPTHVTTYHRPGRPTHVVRSGARPTHVQRTVTPTRRVTTTRPTHVQRSTQHRSTTHRSTTTRRTYRR